MCTCSGIITYLYISIDEAPLYVGMRSISSATFWPSGERTISSPRSSPKRGKRFNVTIVNICMAGAIVHPLGPIQMLALLFASPTLWSPMYFCHTCYFLIIKQRYSFFLYFLHKFAKKFLFPLLPTSALFLFVFRPTSALFLFVLVFRPISAFFRRANY